MSQINARYEVLNVAASGAGYAGPIHFRKRLSTAPSYQLKKTTTSSLQQVLASFFRSPPLRLSRTPGSHRPLAFAAPHLAPPPSANPLRPLPSAACLPDLPAPLHPHAPCAPSSSLHTSISWLAAVGAHGIAAGSTSVVGAQSVPALKETVRGSASAGTASHWWDA